MKCMKDIDNFLDNIDSGDPIYKVGVGYNDIILAIDEWQYANDLRKSDNWLERCVALELRRKFSFSDNEMVLRDRENIKDNILRHVRRAIYDVARMTSPAVKPNRTKAYKEMVDIAQAFYTDGKFINDMLPILNYYFDAKTDTKDNKQFEVHKKNVFGLFEILRKKYGNK